MEVFRNALLLILVLLEELTPGEHSTPLIQENSEKHSPRERRNVFSSECDYNVEIALFVPNEETFQQILSVLNVTTFPVQLDNDTSVCELDVTTECLSAGAGIQCRCLEEFVWPYTSCVTHGACDSVQGGVCQCINAVPADGQLCQPVSELVAQAEYEVDVQLNVTDLETLEYLRGLLLSGNLSLGLTPTLNITQINITTVCHPVEGDFRCTCEDQYVWSLSNCITYGACDEIVNDTCTCINNTPLDQLYCKPKTNVASTIHRYQISVEIYTTDLNALRDGLNTTFPIKINSQVNILNIELTTVCSSSMGGFQCQCEDEYRWSCDQCLMYQSCDNITEDTCGCIGSRPPDGAHCQSVLTHNFTKCPPSDTTTPNPPTMTSPRKTTPQRTPPPSPPTPNTSTNKTTAVISPTTDPQPTPSPTPLTPKTTAIPTTKDRTIGTPSTSIVSTALPTDPQPTPSPTPLTPKTTAIPTTKDGTIGTPSTSIVSTALPTVTDVTLSVELDREFTPDLTNSQSSEYQQLESDINEELMRQYGSIAGVTEVFVTGFRNGSVIADFTVRTTQFDVASMTTANQNLEIALANIAPVLGSVAAQYNSPVSITRPDLTYTGRSMVLMCGPPDVDVGPLSSSEWKINGLVVQGERRRIEFLNNQSNLTISEVISSDAGIYECTLKGEVFDFRQKGESQVTPAPNVRLQSSIVVECEVDREQKIECCVQSPYKVTWLKDGSPVESEQVDDVCIAHTYVIEACSESEQQENFLCRVDNLEVFNATTTLTIFRETPACDDDVYGEGRLGDRASARCDPGFQGSKTAECRETGWELFEDTCILTVIFELLIDSQDLLEEEVPQLASNLSEAVRDTDNFRETPATIEAVVQIITNIANISNTITEAVTQHILNTVDVIIGDDSRESWDFLNANTTSNTSSELLGSMEALSDKVEGTFSIMTDRILFNRSIFNHTFMEDLNNSVVIHILKDIVQNTFITTITFASLHNVMPTRNSTFNITLSNTNETVEENAINGAVVLIKINDTVPNVTLTYNKLNTSLSLNPQCVFWNFTLFDLFGAWDDEGCVFVSDINDTVTCSCDHLTSFSILMAIDVPESIQEALDIITYFGVGISMGSLIICLIIEGYVWKDITRNSTAFMRHVSIINTALSLLIANICFIIGAAIAKNPLENPGENFELPLGPCSTTTFFMHFFYLALFFWMLVSGLLLLYRTVLVFSHMSKSTMLAIGFTFGYACPLIIAVITIAVTAPQDGYIRKNEACWLNWFQTKALLALVIPALVIVVINIVIVIIVLHKMLRRGIGDASQTDERHTLFVIVRCVAILTPLFGLTWSLGVGTMISSTNKGIHIVFALFNSLQGFFILVFGTLLDSKIRALLVRRIPSLSTGSHPTRSTSGGHSSSRGLNIFNVVRRNRNIYHVSDAANSSSSGAAESFINT